MIRVLICTENDSTNFHRAENIRYQTRNILNSESKQNSEVSRCPLLSGRSMSCSKYELM